MIPRPPFPLTAAFMAELRSAYASPGRAYHGFAHVEEVAARWEDVRSGPGWERPVETFAAVLFHDAVYVPGAHDNEAQSALLAEAVLARHGVAVDAARVKELILATARHGSLRLEDVDAETALLLDCDMAILGANEERFDSYGRGVAAEYAFLPAEVFAAGRRAFLERLLESPRIFLSTFWHQRLDAAARTNLRRALQGAV